MRSPQRPLQNTPHPTAQILLLQQAKQIQDLTEQCKALAVLAANRSSSSNGPKRPRSPGGRARRELRAKTLAAYVAEDYIRQDRHTRGTAVLTSEFLAELDEAIGRPLLVRDLRFGLLRQYRAWLAGRVAGTILRKSRRAKPRISGATANLHLRQLRALWNHAAKHRWTDSGRKWRAVAPMPPIEWFEEPASNVEAWTAEQLAALIAQAEQLPGDIGTVPKRIFWPAWIWVLAAFGSRVSATMAVRREDFAWGTDGSASILLRAETQKQKQDQRNALPAAGARAVEALLAAHADPLIFGCWPFDPPQKSDGRRKWKVLTKHFMRDVAAACGLVLPANVKTRQFRRTAATIVAERGGNPQDLLGHSSPKVTERHYKDRRRKPVCRQSLLMGLSGQAQRMLF